MGILDLLTCIGVSRIYGATSSDLEFSALATIPDGDSVSVYNDRGDTLAVCQTLELPERSLDYANIDLFIGDSVPRQFGFCCLRYVAVWVSVNGNRRLLKQVVTPFQRTTLASLIPLSTYDADSTSGSKCCQ